MQPAEIFRNNHRKFDVPIASNLHFGDNLLSWLEAITTHTAACKGLPHQLKRFKTREPVASQHGPSSDRTLRWSESQFGIRNLYFGLWHRLRRIRFDIGVRRFGAAGGSAEPELGPGQIGIRSLLVVQ